MPQLARFAAEIPRSEATVSVTQGAIGRPARRAWRHSQLVTCIAVVAALWWAQAFLIPVTVSLLISCALEPFVGRLQAWRVPRSVAVPLVLLMVLGCLGTGTYALRTQAVAFAGRIPDGARTVAKALRGQTSSAGTLVKLQQAAKELEAAALVNRQTRPADGVTAVRIEEATFRWNQWIWQGSHGAMMFAWQMLAVVCLVYYLLMAGDLYRRKIVRIVGPSISDKKVTVQILAEIDRQIERFLIARAVISGMVAVAVWGTFRLLGIEEAGIWATLAAVLFTVPIVGPAMLIVGAGIAGLLQSGSFGLALAAAGLCTVIAAVEGNILQPWLMSRVGEMNAVAVFVSLLFWGWLWGPWGLLLAVPITAAAKAVCERVDDLHPYAEILKA